METKELFSYKDTWLIKLTEKVTEKQNDAPKKQNPNSFSLLLYLYSTLWVGTKMLLQLYIRLVAMISLKLSALPGLSLSSIQTQNWKRQLQYSVCFTVYCKKRKTPKLWDPGDSGSGLERQRWKGISAGPYLPTLCGESVDLQWASQLQLTDRVYRVYRATQMKES